MLRFSILIVTLFLFSIAVISQEAEEDPNAAVQPMYLLKISSGTANVNLGGSAAKYSNEGTDWKHPLGFDFTTGIGFNYLYKNNFGIEANFSYELNYYMYKNTGVNLFLGYRAPYGDIRIKKMFSPTEDNSMYMKIGGGYMFGGSGGVGKDESNYSYTINFASRSSMLVLAEIGKQKRISKSNFMDIGLVVKYGFSNIINSTMNYVASESPLIIQRASSVTKGNYIGVTVRYYHAFKIVSPKVETRRAPDKRF